VKIPTTKLAIPSQNKMRKERKEPRNLTEIKRNQKQIENRSTTHTGKKRIQNFIIWFFEEDLIEDPDYQIGYLKPIFKKKERKKKSHVI